MTPPHRADAGHYPALTSLRFLAALLVFLYHFPPPGSLWDVIAGQGHIGVNIFFVLSGFLIAARYGEALGRGQVSLTNYFLRRAARILPLYYAVFILSQLAGAGRLAFSAERLPEWTLTQGLFSESLHHLVVPTSWSLTVEECFYALAPLLFVAMAGARRQLFRWPRVAEALTLTLVGMLLLGAGVAVSTLLAGGGPGFLRETESMILHTIFGRFLDFAVGVFCAQAFAAPGARWREALGRPWVGLAATLLATVGIVAAQWAMQQAGGITGPRWPRVWALYFLLAPAAGVLILSLTAGANPIARLLSASPLVYLGKISYALYLVQLTPIGKGLFYPLLPRQDGLRSLLLLYAGLTAVSALLYEAVEEPARKLVLRLAGLERKGEQARALRLPRLASALVIALAVAAKASAWVTTAAGGPPVTLEEVRRGTSPSDRLEVGTGGMEWGRDVLLVGLPRRWREGWGADLRAPSALRVFVDGAPVHFARRESDESGPLAFYRGPRAEYLALRVTEIPEELLVVREPPTLQARVQVARLLHSPRSLAPIGLFAALGLAVGLLASSRARASPRTLITFAIGTLVLWWTLALHELAWAPAFLAAECLLIAVLGAGGGGRREAGPPGLTNREEDSYAAP